jgi:hypothetical protein
MHWRWTSAAEVRISNTAMLERPPFLFGPPESFGDGQREICVVTLGGQADGEMTGDTPVEIHLVLKAIHVLIPQPAPAIERG